MWGPVDREWGLWTICLHSNSATDEDVAALEAFLGRFSERFTSLDRVLEEWPAEERSFADRWFHGSMILRILLRKLRRWANSLI
jgi:hypothetical protein